MIKILTILLLLLPFISNGQWSQDPDTLANEWVLRDRQFRQPDKYCLKGTYSQNLKLQYISSTGKLVRSNVNQVTKMYVIKPEWENDNSLPYEVGIIEYYTKEGEKIDFGSIKYVYNEKR